MEVEVTVFHKSDGKATALSRQLRARECRESGASRQKKRHEKRLTALGQRDVGRVDCEVRGGRSNAKRREHDKHDRVAHFCCFVRVWRKKEESGDVFVRGRERRCDSGGFVKKLKRKTLKRKGRDII